MNVFELEATLSLDTSGFDDGLRRARRGMDGASESGSRFGDVLKGSLAASAITKGLDLLAQGLEKVVGITKEAVSAFASYEQLTGGIETLYKTSADAVIKYADQAYQMAGMSANQYMETATGFAASLIQSLGGDTAKAAEYANTAITDMSDNANKMGTSLGSLQYAYQGFAKQNYTMLDNLKLGYGGTKAEMERLLEDAEKIKAAHGEVAEYSMDSYADVVEAIHVVQEEMGITGTTAAEAAGTIEGSLNSAKAAWENLLTGLANGNVDVGPLFDNFLTSAETAVSNIIPAVENALSNIGRLITERGPELAQRGVDLIVQLGHGIAEGIPDFLARLPEIITGIVTFIATNLPKIIEVGAQIVTAIIQGLIQAAPQIAEQAPQIIAALLMALISSGAMLVQAGTQLISFILNGLIAAGSQLLAAGQQLVQRIKAGLVAAGGQLLAAGQQLVQKIASGITQGISQVISAIKSIISRIKSAFTGGGWSSVGGNIVRGIASGITAGVGAIISAARAAAQKALNAAKSFLGIASPSKLFRDEVGVFIGLGVAEGIEDSEDEAVRAAKQLAEKTYSTSQEWLRRQTKFNRLTLEEQLEVWQEIQSQYIQESKQWIQAEEQIFDLREKIRNEHFADEKERIRKETKFQHLSALDQLAEFTDLQRQYERGSKEFAELEETIFDLREKAQNEFTDNVEKLWDNVTDAQDKYADALEKRVDQIAGAYGLFDDVQDREAVSGREMTTNLQRQVNVLTSFYEGLDQLAGRGVGDQLVEEIRQMGPKAADNLDALLAMTDDELSEYVGLYQQKQGLANSVALRELAGLKEETDAQVRENMGAIEDIFDKEAPKLGQSFADGLSQGILEGIPDIVQAATRAAQSALSAGGDMLGLMRVGFGGSGLGTASAGIINSTISHSPKDQKVTINLTMADGSVLARWMFNPLKDYAAAKGQPIVNTA